GPIINEFNKRNIPHQLIDSRTHNGEELMKQANIIISAVGKENVVKAEQLKKGAVLIGVGILRGADGKLHGDYNEEDVDGIASYYTPTPGGVGPVNVAMLFDNVLTATERQTTGKE
ncbi:MAG TPA: bifunctional 5,10-methylene-tetrahydrofolate dehydrogenase/5,10-methylene-tetrahydrofolate cyclohydrolase, partial [Patescibacteria group bacterium]|nr:bifunctional 5,10-methylene-tetrahydrofolate dehydrogenase/5,10-methylene-tetrahydrofolate cyclohydrolase [Patescibacteria group bacterium]